MTSQQYEQTRSCAKCGYEETRFLDELTAAFEETRTWEEPCDKCGSTDFSGESNALPPLSRAQLEIWAINDELHCLSRRKAEIWRWLEFASPLANLGAETYLHRQLSKAGVVDQGLGSTLDVLKKKGLVECERYQNARQESKLLSIKLTNKGRAVARAGLGESAPKKRPKGQLKPRQLR